MKSETFRAIQEDNMGYQDHRAHQGAPQNVQTKVYQPKQMVSSLKFPQFLELNCNNSSGLIISATHSNIRPTTTSTRWEETRTTLISLDPSNV